MQQSYSSIQSNSLVATPARSGEWVARIASSMVILVACLVLIGWQLDLSLLKSMIPGAATMKVNTAVCFLLAGISLKLQLRQGQTALIARIAKWSAITIVTISVLTICEYIFGWNLGIDELLFSDPAAVATSHPGRMGINTAIGLSFTGTALWLIERQERRSAHQPQHQVKVDRTTIAQILTTVTGAIALQAIVGYAYNVRVFYHLSQLTTAMALHTALSLGILCVGILALTSDRGFMRALTSDLIGGEVAKRFIPQAILVPLLIGWLILQGLQANLYDPNFALSLMSMSMVAIWLGLTRQNTGILNRVDYDRKRHEVERERQSAILRASEQKFSAIFNNTFGLIGLFGLDGTVLDLNQSALASIDGQPSDLIGQKCWETPWWKHSPQIQHQLKDSISQAASGQFVRYEVEFPNPSGGLTTTDFSLKPVFDRAGQVVTIVAEGRDITTLKQAQAALEQRNHELNSFAHIVSHDLKAPLRAVANLSQWIEDDLAGLLTADTQAQMTLLRSRVNRMRATIDGLLDYARAGRTEGTTEPVAVAELLLEVIDSLAPPSTFSIEIEPNLPTLNTNRVLLFQVFANLIGNGIKHHERVDGSIQISSRECGDLYEFIIADDGPGIAPEYQANIFTIFQTGNCKNTQDSTGIGLAIVKKIVEREGGTIRLASEIDRGTTFYFTWAK